MIITIPWLKEHLKTSAKENEIIDRLTNIGLEVEGIKENSGEMGKFKIAKVLKTEKHPNADKLKVCDVTIGGKEILKVVCGAPNVNKNQTVVVATVGTTLFNNHGESIKIKKSKFRGELSEGMICGADEIGMGEKTDGIMLIDSKHKAGTQLNKVFSIYKDKIFNIGLTPNRSDAMSHLGVARDLRAFLLKTSDVPTLITPPVSSFHVENNKGNIQIEVVDSSSAPRYCGVRISGVKVKESPKKIKDKLKAIGVKPINNIVDITNFVMQEIGQPLHAFDFDKLNNINVKSLKAGTKFKTLDDEIIKLSKDDLMICSEDIPLCLAGIYGGLESGVSDSTKNLFLESAIFDSVTIRKSSKRHQLFTDASYRYERGVDPEKVIYALKRAANLIKEDNPDCIISGVFSEDNLKFKKKDIYLRYEKIAGVCGKEINHETITQILSSLDFEIVGITEYGINIIAPNYRHDVYREIDVIEEILRVYGYDNINTENKISMSIPEIDKSRVNITENTICQILIGNGFDEIINNSICSSSINDNFRNTPVTILNPQGSELSNLRSSLIPGVLETIKHNSNRQNKSLKLFEIGNNYYVSKDNYFENKRLNVAITGSVFEENWITDYKENNFYYLKGISDNLLDKLSISNYKYKISQDDNFEFKLNIISHKRDIGFIGELDRNYTKNFSIDDKVHILNLDLDKIRPKSFNNKFEELSKFPSSRRDLSMILDDHVKFEDIKTIAYKLESKILKNVNLFDEYKGKNIGDKKKSFAVSFTFNDSKKTLTDKIVDKVITKFTDAFKSELGAIIREK